mmetsp:Transcript_25775/g.86600  ORF Transcript_25775/g.86600 Transcript_25775/m.86600 type:complete len:283 (+) Transcript_25775:1021-1869(+)
MVPRPRRRRVRLGLRSARRVRRRKAGPVGAGGAVGEGRVSGKVAGSFVRHEIMRLRIRGHPRRCARRARCGRRPRGRGVAGAFGRLTAPGRSGAPRRRRRRRARHAPRRSGAPRTVGARDGRGKHFVRPAALQKRQLRRGRRLLLLCAGREVGAVWPAARGHDPLRFRRGAQLGSAAAVRRRRRSGARRALLSVGDALFAPSDDSRVDGFARRRFGRRRRVFRGRGAAQRGVPGDEDCERPAARADRFGRAHFAQPFVAPRPRRRDTKKLRGLRFARPRRRH